MVQKSHLTLRLDPDLLERLDLAAEKLSKRAAGAEITRSTVARLAVERGLDAIEAELAKKK